MKPMHHITLGKVRAIPKASRPDKTRKHFYAPWERWEQVCSSNPRQLFATAQIEGCPPPIRCETHPSDLPEACLPILHDHHDTAYMPAYGAALSHHESVVAPKRDGQPKSLVLAPNGVILVVGTMKSPIVLSAFRPTPQHGPFQSLSLSDYQAQSRWYFQRGTGVTVRLYTASDVEYLLRTSATEPKTSPTGIWNLALAAGITELLPENELEALPAAAHVELKRRPRYLCQRVMGSVDACSLVSRLVEALFPWDEDEFDVAFSQLEDGLLALRALGAKFEIRTALQQLAGAISTNNIPERALDRVSAWSAIPLPEQHPLASLLMLMKGQPVEFRSKMIQTGVKELWGGAARAIRSELSQWLQVGLTLESVAVLGDKADRWDLQLGAALPEIAHIRVFAVDDDNPEGQEITTHIVGGGPSIWRVDHPGDWVTVIVFACDNPISGASLREIEDWLQPGVGATAQYRTFSRPN